MMTLDSAVKTAAQKALKPIVQGQHPTGGWDYNMRQTERDDTSYMGWCAQAVCAARKAGNIEVEGLENAYQNIPAGFRKNAHDDGGFGYTGKARSGLSGTGAYCMQISGASKDEAVTKTMSFLDTCTYSFEKWDQQPFGGNFPVYYWYYITQAKFNKGGDCWTKWKSIFLPELIKRQVVIKKNIADLGGTMRDIGYWDSPSEKEQNYGSKIIKAVVFYKDGVATVGETSIGARVQNTCLTALQLMVYYRYPPVFLSGEVTENR
jgi:hypothetical protein